jgi:hypothetical protein
MRDLKNKVFILGAGASKPAGAPLINDFFATGIFHLTHGTAFPDKLDNYKNFFAYLKNKYGFDINNPDPYKSDPFAFVENTKINIEQILSNIEEETSDGNKNMEDVRKEAVRFVFITLENAVKYGSNNNCYPDFVKKKVDIFNDESTIITFNYEIMLERALPRGCFSYGIDIDKDKIINFSSYEKSYKNNLLLLKLHGSLNWAVCSLCKKMYLFWSQRYDDISKKKCEGCNANLEAVLIPPTRVKRNHLKNLRKVIGLEKLWKMAKEKIIFADEITIIGYSFGEYDYEATGLILNNVKDNIKKPVLYITDPNAEKIYSKIENSVLERNHFEKVYLFNGFKEYLTNS